LGERNKEWLYKGRGRGRRRGGEILWYDVDDVRKRGKG